MKEPKVLLIEDNEGDIELIRESFNQEVKKNIRICTNGEDAISFINNSFETESYKPDLILLDINLPKVDGKEVLYYLKNDHRYKSIPIVILTSSALPKDIDFAYENHANSYIVKPSNLKEFTEAIRCIELFWIDCVAHPKN